MAAGDPVLAARQAAGALYNSDLPYTSGNGFKPRRPNRRRRREFRLAQGGPARRPVGHEQQGEALRQLSASAPDILRAAQFGLDGGTLPP